MHRFIRNGVVIAAVLLFVPVQGGEITAPKNSTSNNGTSKHGIPSSPPKSTTPSIVIADTAPSPATVSLGGGVTKEDDKRAYDGAALVRFFESPGYAQEYAVASVTIDGQRYGSEPADANLFDIALCDRDMHPIAMWQRPYTVFSMDAMAAVRVPVPVTVVPKQFFVVLQFRSNPHDGVYLAFDRTTNGDSGFGQLNKHPMPFTEGNWVVSVELRKGER